MNRRTSAWTRIRPHWGRKALSVLLTLALCLTLLPGAAFAAQTGSTDANRTVFDALGFDTTAPEGYQQDESITDTPFGKTYTTMAEVDELFVLNTNQTAILPILSAPPICLVIIRPQAVRSATSSRGRAQLLPSEPTPLLPWRAISPPTTTVRKRTSPCCPTPTPGTAARIERMSI